MIYVDKSAKNGKIFKNIEKKGIAFELVDNINEFKNDKKNIFITKKQGKYLEDILIHRCPGTKVYRCCNYYVVDVVENCQFSCSYCILHVYLKHRYIKVNDNIEDIITGLKKLDQCGRFRVGSGELSDSLALDDILGLSNLIIPEINNLNNILFEFKTKSNNISNLLNLSPKNVIVSWSLNPQYIVDLEEISTSSLEDRLKAAEKCGNAGFKLAFHFDPIIFCEDFEKQYRELIEKLVVYIDENMVRYISLSTFRFLPELYDYVRVNYTNSMLLESHFVKSLDGKFRYFKAKRYYMLSYVYKYIRKYWKKVFIYFCMESSSIWKKVMGFDPGISSKESLISLGLSGPRQSFEKLFIGDNNECISKF